MVQMSKIQEKINPFLLRCDNTLTLLCEQLSESLYYWYPYYDNDHYDNYYDGVFIDMAEMKKEYNVEMTTDDEGNHLYSVIIQKQAQ